MRGNEPSPLAASKPAVLEQLDRVDNSLSYLHSVINALEDRLAAVTRGSGPDSAMKAGSAIPTCPLSGRIEDQADRVYGACARIRDILDRLEV